MKRVTTQYFCDECKKEFSAFSGGLIWREGEAKLDYLTRGNDYCYDCGIKLFPERYEVKCLDCGRVIKEGEQSISDGLMLVYCLECGEKHKEV